MGKKILGWVADSVRFAVSIIFFLCLDPFVPKADGLIGKIGSTGLTALVSGFLAFVVVEYVAGRPTLELSWKIDSYDAADRRPQLNLGNQCQAAIGLDVKLSGNNLMSHYILWRSKSLAIKCRVEIWPPGVISYREQLTLPGTTVSNTGVEFVFSDGLRSGANVSCEFSIETQHASNNPIPLDCNARIRRSDGRWSPSCGLIKVSTGVDGFSMRSN